MGQIWLLLIRGLFGGAMVVAFSVIAELVKPKVFSGLFSAAPSIAIASLLVAAYTVGPSKAGEAAVGMFGGAVAMVACTITAAHAVKRYGAVAGSAAAWVAWAAVAGVVYVGFIR
jgi:Protein of unknown function (DUF3147)